MTAPLPEGADGPRTPCPSCRGPFVDGRIALAVTGSLRFVYRLGDDEIATEVSARMCTNCSHVVLEGRPSGHVARVQASGKADRWASNERRPPVAYRSRYG